MRKTITKKLLFLVWLAFLAGDCILAPLIRTYLAHRSMEWSCVFDRAWQSAFVLMLTWALGDKEK
jgi:hypothetical protein